MICKVLSGGIAMIIRGTYFLLLCCTLFNTIQASSFTTAMNLFQKTFKLESIEKVFNQKYSEAPNLVCQGCKMAISYGDVIGTVLGFGLKIAMAGGDAGKHEKFSEEIFGTILMKNISDIDTCVLGVANSLPVACSQCEAVNWAIVPLHV